MNWFRPPRVGEGEEQQRATLLNAITLIMLALLGLLVVGAWLDEHTMRGIVWVDVLLIANALLARFWLQRGRLRLAGAWLVAWVYLLLTLAVILRGTIRTPSTSAYILLVVIVGLLFERRGIALVTLASSLAILGLALAEIAGWLPPPYQHATLAQWAVYSGLIGLTGGLTYYAYGILQRALASARLEVAERACVEAELRRLTRAMQWQRDLAQDLALATAVRPALQLCLERILEITHLDCGGVGLVDQAARQLELITLRGLPEALAQKWARLPAGSRAWQAANAGQPIYTNFEQLTSFDIAVELGEGLRALGVIPVLVQGQVMACFIISSHTQPHIEPADQALIEEIALHLGSALARIRALEDLQRSHDQLRLSEEQFRAVFESSGVGMLMGDLQGRFLRVNPAYCQMLGYSEAELLGRSLQDVLLPEDMPATHAAALQLIDGGLGMAQMEKCYQKHGGELIWVSSTANLVRDAAGRPLHIVAIVQNITARKHMEGELRRINQQLNEQLSLVTELKDQLRDQAVRDALTGLYNRRFLHEALPGEMARARRQGSPIGVILMDIDHFKSVNDAYGHAAGDEVLRALAGLLRHYVRDSDIACRFGGEEFLLVLGGADLEASVRRARQLRQACAQVVVMYQGQQIEVTISLGVAVYPLHGENMDEVLDNADRALYRSKQAGRDRVTVWG